MNRPEEGPVERLDNMSERSLWMPKHLVRSAWTEHAPFAFWLVDVHRPRSIVELGTHNGLSYFTFCQAVAELGLATRCFAVDTWQGDEHAGFYSDEVYELVARVNADHYAGFSRLVRSTFDDAAEHFENGSIDLLHIDGRHFYADVAHDFETWYPKLSSRAVVLFHDTNVREKGFGVHQLWAEVAERHVGAVEFLHGHGLGVLQVGAEVSESLSDWFTRHRDPVALVGLRATYARLGQGVLDHFEVKEASGRHQELRDKLTAANAAIERRNESIERSRADRERSQAEQRRTEEDLVRARAEAERLRAGLASREKSLRELREYAVAASSSVDPHAREAAELREQLTRLRSRRVVRLSLSVADLFRPVFRLVRRARRSRSRRFSTAPVNEGRSAATKPEPRVTGSSSPPPRWSRSPSKMMVDLDRDGKELRSGLDRAGLPTIIVPIFNAPRELARCLTSIERNTTVAASLLLINDASTDPLIEEVLAPWRHRRHVRVLDHAVNRGFTATVNHGLAETDGDVIILNSDTEVPPAWVQNLRRAAYTDARLGTVTPLSDNSGAFSVPNIGVPNPIPPHLGTDGIGRCVARGSLHELPDTPTGNGFCWYVKRSVLHSVGTLDEVAFPRGYGEENDLSMRASKAGWRHAVDDATLVAHTREASFGSEKKGLVASGRRIVDERHPDYTDKVRAFVTSEAMDAVRKTVRGIFDDPPDEVHPRVLHVAQIGLGGTPATTRDLAGALQGWEALVFESDGKEVRLVRIEAGDEIVLESFRLSRAVGFAQVDDEEYDAALAGVIRRYGIELVHIRHLIKQPLSAPRVAAALGVPVVVSFHDYYFSCPSIHLLDDQERFCGGTCTPGMGSCRIPTAWIEDDAPTLKHAWVYTWREMVSHAFQHVDAFVTTSDAAHGVMTDSLPQLRERRFEVIEHGRDIRQESLAASPPLNGPVRVLVPGNLDVHKGERLLRGIKSLDVSGHFEFHFVGNTGSDAGSLGIVHGSYDRDSLADLVRDIRPSFAAILSPWGETYCHTLTEAWSLGLPVLACDEGALGERVRRHGGGLVVDPYDVDQAYRTMIRLVEEPELHGALTLQADAYTARSVADMAHDYEELYQDVVHARRVFTAEQGRPRVGLLVPGRADPAKWTGSTHVRFGRRYGHPRTVSGASVRYLHAVDDVLEHELDAVFVLRNGVLDRDLDRLLEIARGGNVRVVLDLDDALTEREMFPVGSPWRETAADIARLAVEADLVTVSTEPLRQLISERYNENVVIEPNLLDERIWFSPIDPEPTESDRPARILYFGSTTHAADLDLLRNVIPLVATRLGRDVRFEVVGIAPASDDENWFDRLEIPDGSKAYPRFVNWLRRNRNRWDVGVAPLQAGGFNDYKSDLKFLELTALSLPTVASRVPAYEATIGHGRSGYLAHNDLKSWVNGLVQAFDSEIGGAWARNALNDLLDSRLQRSRPLRLWNAPSKSAHLHGGTG